MAAEPLPPPDSIEQEDGGGPVKPFLEHLEDLRWTIIKVLGVVIISMIVCLVAGNWLVRVLTWPLAEAKRLTASSNQVISLKFGNSEITKVPLKELPTNLWAGGRPSALRLVPTSDPTNPANFTLQVSAEYALPDNDPESRGIVQLKNYGPMGGIMVALELALYGGISLASPFVMLFIGQFVLPALRMHEKRFLYRAVGIGVGLFLLGIVFCYFVIMQITLLATVQFSQWLGFTADEWRAEDYIDFILKMMLAVGLSFQLPVVVLTLVKVGVLDYEKLARSRSYFIVGNMVACAFVTPSGDPFTMLLLAVPVQILYEISVFIAKGWWRREQRELAAAEV